MRYLIEPRHGIYVKEHGFLSFAKKMSNKYSQKRLDSAKKIYKRYNKDSFKKRNSKKADATGDLIGDELIKNNKSDKITNLSKNVSKELHSQNGDEIEIPKEG